MATPLPSAPRLLLVDDNPQDLAYLTDLLTTAMGSVSVGCASSLDEALQQLVTTPPQIVLLDLKLPDSEGVEGLQRLLSVAPALPVVVVSGNDDDGMIDRAMRAGAQDYLLKSELASRRLGQVVHFAIERQQTNAALRRSKEDYRQRAESELRRNHEQESLLVQQGRQAAMGEMLGHIAHQWRQPLNSLALLLHNLQHDFIQGTLDGNRCDDYVERGNLMIQLMSSTIDDFRSFYQPRRSQHAFSVRTALDTTLRLLEAGLVSRGIRVEVNGCECLCRGSENEFVQVVMNLVGNARDVLLERHVRHGRITIRTACHRGWGVVRFQDNGGGVADRHLAHLFEPYFTTKRSGTGIGLYISRIIMEHKLAGHLRFHNTGEGACFTLMLPQAIEASANLVESRHDKEAA